MTSIFTKLANLFVNAEESSLKLSFGQASQALRDGDVQTLTTVLGQTKFDTAHKGALLVQSIANDNVEGFKTIFNMTNTHAAEELLLNKSDYLNVQTLETPMLPYALSRGSEKISVFLASHPGTDLNARARLTNFNMCVCGATGSVFAASRTVVLRNAQSLANKACLQEAAGIINARLAR